MSWPPFSPEREDPGNVLVPRAATFPKVIGGVDHRATAAAQALYGAIFTRTIPMSTPAAAEMTKLLENIYRSVNIALVNEMKQMCLAMGIDLWEVITAAATKPFGFQPFYPGPGVGGHCIPVDPFYLTWKARQFGFSTRFIELAGEVNESMPAYVVQATRTRARTSRFELSAERRFSSSASPTSETSTISASLPPSPSSISFSRPEPPWPTTIPFFPSVGEGRKYRLNLRSTPLDRLEDLRLPSSSSPTTPRTIIPTLSPAPGW